MYYNLITQLVNLIEVYDKSPDSTSEELDDFLKWVGSRSGVVDQNRKEPDWVGKTNGRSAESVINTSLVHLYRYAKLQAKSAISGTEFATQDDFIYLISLTSYGSMNKSALIKLNVHEKPVGIQIINRLIKSGMVEQQLNADDRRNRMIHITDKGRQALTMAMAGIKNATLNVTEPLSMQEKMDLIHLLNKLENHHEQKALQK